MSNYITTSQIIHFAAYGDSSYGSEVYGDQTTTTQNTPSAGGSTALANTGVDVFLVVGLAIASIVAGLFLITRKKKN